MTNNNNNNLNLEQLIELLNHALAQKGPAEIEHLTSLYKNLMEDPMSDGVYLPDWIINFLPEYHKNTLLDIELESLTEKYKEIQDQKHLDKEDPVYIPQEYKNLSYKELVNRVNGFAKLKYPINQPKELIRNLSRSCKYSQDKAFTLANSIGLLKTDYDRRLRTDVELFLRAGWNTTCERYHKDDAIIAQLLSESRECVELMYNSIDKLEIEQVVTIKDGVRKIELRIREKLEPVYVKELCVFKRNEKELNNKRNKLYLLIKDYGNMNKELLKNVELHRSQGFRPEHFWRHEWYEGQYKEYLKYADQGYIVNRWLEGKKNYHG
jgi:hypothetical protein